MCEVRPRAKPRAESTEVRSQGASRTKSDHFSVRRLDLILRSLGSQQEVGLEPRALKGSHYRQGEIAHTGRTQGKQVGDDRRPWGSAVASTRGILFQEQW